mmetsp:Transcript_27409/g.89718  ORF Transcript_27409/g.89718 Transcript_27409/m.89718 type:complete len:420 (+) Transcript_27409:1393-2652(+)
MISKNTCLRYSVAGSTLSLTRCQLLLLRPRTLQMGSARSGWTLDAASTALTHTSAWLASTGTVASQRTQAHARSSFCSLPSVSVASRHVRPPSPETSTRTMPRPPPLHAYPLTSTSSPGSTAVPGLGEVMALWTGISWMLGTRSTSTPSKLLVCGPNGLYAMPRCHGPSASSAAHVMRSTHLTERTPTCPGTTIRSGKPWSRGSGSPFISHARRTSPRSDIALAAGMDACMSSMPCACTWNTPASSALASPHSLRTSRRLTPPHSAVPIAAARHGHPLVLATALRPSRRFPPHWIDATTVFFANFFWSSARLKERSSTPSPPITTRCSSALSTTGTGWWLRTKKSSEGVRHVSACRPAGGSARNGLVVCTIRPGKRVGSAPNRSVLAASASAAACAAASTGSNTPICISANISKGALLL